MVDAPRTTTRREEVAEKVIIVQAGRDDCLEILALQRLAYVQEAEIYRDFTIPPLRQTLGELMDEFERSVVLKALLQNTIIGSVRACVKNRTCNIGRLIVHPARQNQGIGKMLMEALEAHFADSPIDKFELFTGERSVKNISFYAKLGYRAARTEHLSETVNLVFFEKAKSAAAK